MFFVWKISITILDNPITLQRQGNDRNKVNMWQVQKNRCKKKKHILREIERHMTIVNNITIRGVEYTSAREFNDLEFFSTSLPHPGFLAYLYVK